MVEPGISIQREHYELPLCKDGLTSVSPSFEKDNANVHSPGGPGHHHGGGAPHHQINIRACGDSSLQESKISRPKIPKRKHPSSYNLLATFHYGGDELKGRGRRIIWPQELKPREENILRQ